MKKFIGGCICGLPHIQWFLLVIRRLNNHEMKWRGVLLSFIRNSIQFSVQAVYLSSPGMKQSNRGTLSAEIIHLPKLIAAFCCSRPPNGFTSAHSAKCTHTHKRCISQAYSLMQSTKESTVQHTMMYIVTLYVNLLKSKDKVAQISTNLVYCYCCLLP